MIYLKKLLLTFCACSVTLFLVAQNTLRGKVIDSTNGEPLIGASVLVDGTTEGTVTDFDGNFEFKTESPFPVTVMISYVGYEELPLTINDENAVKINLEEIGFTTETVEVTGQRISEKQKSAPLTVESLDVLAIKETPADNFYDGLGALKGVDLTAASLGFKVINTRGFNSTSPVRSLQIIDGVDNQAPGLNFSLGNFLGSSELDVLRVDIIQGAASAFYGPSAFNGVISMETKNPFYSKGLGAFVKAGERNMVNGALRWADAFNNKDGHPFMAYKMNFSYLRADDWEAKNYDAVDDTDSPTGNPGGWDRVNSYGDEYFSLGDFSDTLNVRTDRAGLGIFHRQGYNEIDVVDYDTRNIKANLAVHFRTNPSKDFESPELILSSSFGTGTTVYQGDNRFSLRNILFFQNRLEFRKKDKYFIRAYATHEDAGDSYDPYFTALELLNRAKTNENWYQDYTEYWRNNIYGQMLEGGIPKPETAPPPIFVTFDEEGAFQWLADNQIELTQWHAEAAAVANQEDPLVPDDTDFFVPGSDRFKSAFDSLISLKNTEGGTRFYDKSALYHVHGEYNFETPFMDNIKVGANYRLYNPKSEGTVFKDTADVTISNSEVGFYLGLQKDFTRKFKLTGTVRLDKNENFDLLVTPAASLVYSP
ncbi:MAG: TonB-dependent receptor plug domain-containing protein, partial [Saprospiraceae bacterium]|nr:TonB-dependent receptor plug domain-containing protein [Saprospiraceae bacterium]